MQIPDYITKLLWDVKIQNLSMVKDADFIIERVLEYGDQQEFSWLEANFEREQIINKLISSVNLSAKSANFYAFIYQIPKNQVVALQKNYLNKQSRFSS